jgi:hypothetical protein
LVVWELEKSPARKCRAFCSPNFESLKNSEFAQMQGAGKVCGQPLRGLSAYPSAATQLKRTGKKYWSRIVLER